MTLFILILRPIEDKVEISESNSELRELLQHCCSEEREYIYSKNLSEMDPAYEHKDHALWGYSTTDMWESLGLLCLY